ncbi:MAG: hypothetical protein JWP97_1455 [Labilithrix sp.]|nr:hypothetical protein [Labilithrix sp.]
MRVRAPLAVLVAAAGLAGCGGCGKGDSGAGPAPPVSAPAPRASSPAAVAELLPRCRASGEKLVVPGEDVVVGDAVLTGDALVAGIVRREGGQRTAGVLRVPLDLSRLDVTPLGAAPGDDPPPSPRLRGGTVVVSSYARRRAGEGDGGSAGASTRRLEVARLEAGGVRPEATVVQQADESLAYDIAWTTSDGPGLVAWDEDAPPLPQQLLVDRGVVKVQLLATGATARIASPDRSDAEAPRLLARAGGYWLAWIARRNEATEDGGAASAVEALAERRAFRWVEIVALDAKGEATSPVRRVSPERGHVASFDLVRSGDQVVVLAQDETAHVENAGERIVRFTVDGERIEGTDVVDGGIGHALADLLVRDGGHFLAFLDRDEHAHLLPLGPALAAAGPTTAEPVLDAARVLGLAPPDSLFAVATTPAGGAELRRFTCR